MHLSEFFVERVLRPVWSSNKPFNPEHYPWEAPVKEQLKNAEDKNVVQAEMETDEFEAGETKNAETSFVVTYDLRTTCDQTSFVVMLSHWATQTPS